MNAYYETFLRKDIFPNNDTAADKICDIYETNPQEKAYIIRVLDWYIGGGSKYSTINMLKNLISKVKRIEDTHSYLDEEYQKTMKERD